MMPQVLIAGLMIAMALSFATLAWLSLWRRDRARHGPTYRRLCRALGIPTSDRRLLCRVARTAGTPPASLLLSRGCFDEAAARAGGGTSRRLAVLRRHVFG